MMCSHGKVGIAGVTMTDRFSLGPNDVCYVAMPLFHSNAVLVGWSVALACRGSMVLRRKFSASQFLPDIRRYGATYANYVGKPLSYVLATRSVPTTPTIRCARCTATKAHPLTSSASPADSGAW
ncbi:AMP-binding enzyme family protein [Mycobacterium xenopi 3993]|nr:AMP-binding enzyme family protein [Mycobacterium xenopi 3993]